MTKYQLVLPLLICSWLLTACTATVSNNEPPAAFPTPTEIGLVEVTATVVPSPIPATPTPNPTATAAPVATSVPPASPLPDSPLQLPADLQFVFSQEGGFAGIKQEWVIDRRGRVTQNGVEVQQLTEGEISDLYQILLDNNFFTLAPTYKAEEICCDFFTYRLTVTANGQDTTAIAIGEPPETPEWLWNCLVPIIRITNRPPSS
ncbi:MAG: hypothetical protein KJ063_15025 [Anaerolineae bacterium]|nr:hypothetical protein [Anaerolineae bacterium]